MIRTIGEMLDQPQEFQSWLHEITAYQAVIHAVATTQLLDQWDSEPIRLEELAARTLTQEPQLGRLIDFLVSQQVLGLLPDGSIVHTQRSRALRSFRPATKVQAMALRAGLHLGEAIGSGKTAFEACFGMPVFQYFATNPEQAGFFGERMSQMTAHDETLLLGQLRLAPFALAVDIGGSHGTLLSALLARHREARGIVFDLPDVIERASARLRTVPAANRIEAIGGDFFAAVPAGADLYLIKQILHNWSDEQCVAILRRVRDAIAPGGRVVIMERLLPDTLTADPAYVFDVLMMIWSTGQERTRGQLGIILERAGFAIDEVIQNPGRMSIIGASAR